MAYPTDSPRFPDEKENIAFEMLLALECVRKEKYPGLEEGEFTFTEQDYSDAMDFVLANL